MSMLPQKCSPSSTRPGVSSPCISSTPHTVAVMPARANTPARSLSSAHASTAVMAGVAPVKMPASAALVRAMPLMSRKRKRNMPISACRPVLSQSPAVMTRTLAAMRLAQIGSRNSSANIMLTAVMVNVPKCPETMRAHTTDVPASVNAPVKNAAPFNF